MLKKEKRKQPKFFKLEGNTDKDYIAKNRHAWNEKTSIHVDSEFYHHADFLEGKTSLKEIELALLGNIAGKKNIAFTMSLRSRYLVASSYGCRCYGR